LSNLMIGDRLLGIEVWKHNIFETKRVFFNHEEHEER